MKLKIPGIKKIAPIPVDTENEVTNTKMVASKSESPNTITKTPPNTNPAIDNMTPIQISAFPLGNAVKTIFENPDIGDIKVGDLQGIQIYKFKSMNNQILLAYEVDLHILHLYAFGSHENFYRDLKKHLH